MATVDVVVVDPVVVVDVMGFSVNMLGVGIGAGAGVGVATG